jgi:hypothetical protein
MLPTLEPAPRAGAGNSAEVQMHWLMLLAQAADDDVYPYEGMFGGFLGSWTFFLICFVLGAGALGFIWWKKNKE